MVIASALKVWLAFPDLLLPALGLCCGGSPSSTALYPEALLAEPGLLLRALRALVISGPPSPAALCFEDLGGTPEHMLHVMLPCPAPVLLLPALLCFLYVLLLLALLPTLLFPALLPVLEIYCDS